MDRLFTLLVTLIVAAGLMYAWDRHPPIEFSIPIPVIPDPKISIPPGPVFAAEARAQAAEKANATCQGSFAGLTRAIEAQKTAVDGLQAKSVAIQRQIAQGAQAATAASRAAILRSNDLLELQLGGLDACAAFKAVDAQVVRGIK